MTDKDHCSQCGATLNEFEKTTSSLYKGHSLVGTCSNCKIKWVKENHGDADSELFKLRDKARHRNFKFMQKKRAAGSRQCSAILSQDAYNTLTRLRDAAAQTGKPQSFGDIIEAALNVYVSLGQSKQNDTTSEHKDDDTGDSKDNAIYVCSDDDINTEQESKQNYICVKEIEDPTPEPKSEMISDLPETQEQRPKHSDLNDLPDPAPTEKNITEHEPGLFDDEQTAPDQEETKPPKRGTPEYRKWLFEYMDEQRKSKVGWAEIADQLNTHGLKPLRGEKFNKTNAGMFYNRVLKELAKKS